MKLEEILSISGQPGLFRFVAQGTNGIIVEALKDNRRTNIPSTAQVSSMGEIAIYTMDDDIPLSDVFNALFEKTEGKQTISHKSSGNELKELFSEIVPDYDPYMVHVSDMKKIVSWYNLLVDAGMTDFSLSEENDGEEQEEDAEQEGISEDKE